ncbi:hypothetical protein BASA81_007535 [Batrachochytrium salamandrivorans]|nr:hypothetical protein BASA81_007535 [Batrachochytrium salamandrivorans]
MLSASLESRHVAKLVYELINRLAPEAPLSTCTELASSLLLFPPSPNNDDVASTPELELLKTHGSRAHELYQMLAEKDSELANQLTSLLLQVSRPATPSSSSQELVGLLPPPPAKPAASITLIASSYRGVKDFLSALRGSAVQEGRPGEARFITRAMEIGQIHRRIRQYADRELVEPVTANGLVVIRFAHAIQDELNAADQFLVVLEKQRAHLAQLFAWSQAFGRRLEFVWQICESCRGMVGGTLVSNLFALHLSQGSNANKQLVGRLLAKAFKPLRDMLIKLCAQGQPANDPGQEFFVTIGFEVNWRMLPRFISPELAVRACKLARNARVANRLGCLLQPPSLSISQDGEGMEENLEQFVLETEKQINAQIKHKLFEGHLVLEHLRALKDFLLLSRGDFCQLLVDGVEDAKRNDGGLQMQWQSQLEFALENSTAQTLPRDILLRITMRQSPSNDLFCLDYLVDFPLNLLVIELDGYFDAFGFLWRVKRVGQLLDGLWKRHAMRERRRHQATSQVRHKSNLVRAEMHHLVSNLHSYIMTEVIDASWDQLVADLQQASSLDDFAACHHTFLHSVLVKGLIKEDEEAKQQQEETGGSFVGATPSKSPIFSLKNKLHSNDTRGLPEQVKRLLELIVNFCQVQEDRNGEEELASEVDSISSQFWQELHLFLHSLRSCTSESLRVLAWRLDFNRFY